MNFKQILGKAKAILGQEPDQEPSFGGYSIDAQRIWEQQERQKELTSMLAAKEQQLRENHVQTQYISISPKIQNRRERNIAKRQERLALIKAKQEDWKRRESLRKIKVQLQLERIKQSPRL